MELVKDREIFSNPYIIQMDKFADSLIRDISVSGGL